MRNLVVVVVVLLCSLQLVSSDLGVSDLNKVCCYNFTKVVIPLKRIKSHSWTSSNCPTRALIFQTVNGRQFCVDHTAAWVKLRMDQLKISTR
ncbi:eotaxin-like [Hoplias malabaricus]|uniref:eotaxin-like n=1 Tax=Hoplias malabaricus TaxID=27720 RepID=UPI0034631FFC